MNENRQLPAEPKKPGDNKNCCERCGAELDPKTALCPECDEAAPPWLVWVVYVLVALFACGLVYRLIFP